MRKLVTMVLCLIAVTSFGQLKMGIEAGLNISQFSDKGNNQQYYHLSNINTFQAGIAVEEKLKKHIFLQTGLYYAQKGGNKFTTQLASDGSSTTLRLNYLQIPLNLVYKFKLTSSLTALAGAGLYESMGISGTDKGTNTDISGTSPVNNKVDFSDNTSFVDNGKTYIKPFETGYNVLVGLEWDKFQFKVTMSNGFKGVFPTGSTSFLNHIFGISAACLIPWN